MFDTPMPACEVDLAYPPVAASSPDIAFACLLAADYAGKKSEVTAVMQYSYQHAVLKETDPSLSETISCISITEMRHVEMLAELILLLGGDPRYYGCCRCDQNPWCGAFPNYATSSASILGANIAGEIAAIESYRTRIGQTNDPAIRALIKRIILDEQRHLEIFSWYRDRLPKG